MWSTARIAIYFDHGKLKKYAGVFATIRLLQTDHKNFAPHIQIFLMVAAVAAKHKKKSVAATFMRCCKMSALEVPVRVYVRDTNPQPSLILSYTPEHIITEETRYSCQRFPIRLPN